MTGHNIASWEIQTDIERKKENSRRLQELQEDKDVKYQVMNHVAKQIYTNYGLLVNLNVRASQ